MNKELFIKKYGFNPLVITDRGLNKVILRKAIELNKDNLEYLKNLAIKHE